MGLTAVVGSAPAPVSEIRLSCGTFIHHSIGGIYHPATQATGESMNIHLTLGPLISLIAGVLILVMPRLLNFIVAIYLIIIGLVGLFGAGQAHFF
jgi:Protein of unknown function (DUF3096)